MLTLVTVERRRVVAAPLTVRTRFAPSTVREIACAAGSSIAITQSLGARADAELSEDTPPVGGPRANSASDMAITGSSLGAATWDSFGSGPPAAAAFKRLVLPIVGVLVLTSPVVSPTTM